jgi:hypothetical protein
MLPWFPSSRLITRIGNAVVGMWPPEQIRVRWNNLTYIVTFPGGKFKLERDTNLAGTRDYLSVKVIVPNNIGDYYANTDTFFDRSADGLHRTCFTQTITRKEDELEFTNMHSRPHLVGPRTP